MDAPFTPHPVHTRSQIPDPETPRAACAYPTKRGGGGYVCVIYIYYRYPYKHVHTPLAITLIPPIGITCVMQNALVLSVSRCSLREPCYSGNTLGNVSCPPDRSQPYTYAPYILRSNALGSTSSVHTPLAITLIPPIGITCVMQNAFVVSVSIRII